MIASKSITIILFSLLIANMSVLVLQKHEVYGNSPSFLQQEIRIGDRWKNIQNNASQEATTTAVRSQSGKYFYYDTTINKTDCNPANFPGPDVKSVSFISNGKTLNT